MKNNKIAIIDYGVGNLRSVAKAVEVVGGDPVVTNQKKQIDSADRVILPGVGAFNYCMDNLKKQNLTEVVLDQIHQGKYFLGICVGFQLLFDSSTEFGGGKGLGVIPGEVVQFQFENNEIKVPHMGWNLVKKQNSSRLFEGIDEKRAFFYFVHSFYAQPKQKETISSLTNYGGLEFCSSIEKDHLFATQFHPEKSQSNGLKILSNFLNFK